MVLGLELDLELGLELDLELELELELKLELELLPAQVVEPRLIMAAAAREIAT